MYVDDADFRGGEYDALHKEKIGILKEILDESQGSPVLVFYRFKAELEIIEKAIPGCRRVTEPGIVREWNAGQVPVLLAHPASASHGLNLQHGGHTAVWTSLCWELELWEQANKRLHRQGQRHPVVVHVIEARGTIDQVIHGRLVKKTRVQDELTDYLEAPV
jgi:SNF2 family DNA or RNA helicase